MGDFEEKERRKKEIERRLREKDKEPWKRPPRFKKKRLQEIEQDEDENEMENFEEDE